MPGHPDPVDDTSVTLMMRLQRFPADPQAWDEFVERYRPMIRAWCLKWQLQDSDAEDVVQDVLIKLVAAIRKFQYDPAQLSSVAQDCYSACLERFRGVAPQGPEPDCGPDRQDRRIRRSEVRSRTEARGRFRRGSA